MKYLRSILLLAGLWVNALPVNGETVLGVPAHCYASRYFEVTYDDPSCTLDMMRTEEDDGVLSIQLNWSDGVTSLVEMSDDSRWCISSHGVAIRFNHDCASIHYREVSGEIVPMSEASGMTSREMLDKFWCVNRVEQDDVYCFRFD